MDQARRRGDAPVGRRRRRCSSRCSRRLHDRASGADVHVPESTTTASASRFAELEQPDGLVHGVVDVSTLIGIVALCLFAGAFASEYSQGTLRNLLVREPRRAQLLCGKFLALALFIGLAVVLEILVLERGRVRPRARARASQLGVDEQHRAAATSAQATLHVFLASVGYGVLGSGARRRAALPGRRDRARRSPTCSRSRRSSSA